MYVVTRPQKLARFKTYPLLMLYKSHMNPVLPVQKSTVAAIGVAETCCHLNLPPAHSRRGMRAMKGE